jgi:hypothetical protein
MRQPRRAALLGSARTADACTCDIFAPRARGCGGIGRRARFRSVSGKPGGGSSPLIRIAVEQQRLGDSGSASPVELAPRGSPGSQELERHRHVRHGRVTSAQTKTAAPRGGRSSASARIVAQRPLVRRWRRCIVTIEKPVASSTMPAAIVQRRSKPVNGSDVAFCVVVGAGVVVGSSFFVSGAVSFFGVEVSFDGEVPLVGVGVVAGVGVAGAEVVVGGGVEVVVVVGGLLVYGLVSSAANTAAGDTRAIIRAKATDSTTSLRALGDPFLIVASSAFCGLLEATTSVRVMPTSRDGLGECSSP